MRIRGNDYFNLGEYGNALTDLDKSLEIEPNDAHALRIRDQVYEMLKT